MTFDASEILCSVRGLQTHFFVEGGTAKSVDGVSFDIRRGETLGLVGESGCGKSVTAMSIMRLIPNPPGRIVGGEILFKGENLLKKSEAQMRKIRGNEISVIFQEPMTSLNPVYTVGSQIIEAILIHQNVGAAEARKRAIEMLRKVGIPSPEVRIDEYPHQMSGGMKQRVMIAMALVCNPSLLIADEPTTALDVTIQAQILDLMRALQSEMGASILLITHDLGVVAEMADHVAVMYAGKIVEYADTKTLFAKGRHPYTIGLFKSIPRVGSAKKSTLHEIPGSVPNPLEFPSGCKFRNRCPYATDKCAQAEPALEDVGEGHTVACFHYKEINESLAVAAK